MLPSNNTHKYIYRYIDNRHKSSYPTCNTDVKMDVHVIITLPDTIACYTTAITILSSLFTSQEGINNNKCVGEHADPNQDNVVVRTSTQGN